MSLVQPEVVTATLNGKTIELKKLPLGKWALLAGKIKAIGGLIKAEAFKSEDTQESLMAMMDLLEKAPEALADICSLVAPVTAEEVKEAPVDEVIELLLKAWHLNNLMRLLGDSRKKALGQTEGEKE